MTRRIRAGASALAFLFLVSCAEGPGGDSGNSAGFRADYLASRGALESGDYALAARRYARLMERAGPLRPRIRLEYAHALLRGDRFAEAADEAGTLAAAQTGPGRAAALAVEGTALHEMALRTPGPDGAGLLRRAGAALSEVVERHPELDPIGTLAARHARIEAALARRG